jgi:dTDP-glucose 4,6-dehydratase
MIFSPADETHILDKVGKGWEKLRGKRLFITGGTGFIGKWLVGSVLKAEESLDLGCRITLLSRSPESFRKTFPVLAHHPALSLMKGDVRNLEWTEEHFDFLIHAATDVAAQNEPLDTFDVCSSGTRRVLDFARHAGVGELLLLSSGAVYGRQPPGLDALPESWNGLPDRLDPKSAYGLGKINAEWLAAQYSRTHGINVKMARCFAFVGPHLPMDKHFAIGNFIRDALSGDAIAINGDGTPLRSYLYVSDLAVWLWKILFEGKAGQAYNVGGDQAVSISQLAHKVNAVLGADVHITCRGVPKAGALPERYVPNVDLARKELGLEICISLDEAIRRTADWYRSEVLGK